MEIIPSSYLSARGGFENLDRLAAALGIHLVGLVSYDQIRFQETGRALAAGPLLPGVAVTPLAHVMGGLAGLLAYGLYRPLCLVPALPRRI